MQCRYFEIQFPILRQKKEKEKEKTMIARNVFGLGRYKRTREEDLRWGRVIRRFRQNGLAHFGKVLK